MRFDEIPPEGHYTGAYQALVWSTEPYGFCKGSNGTVGALVGFQIELVSNTSQL